MPQTRTYVIKVNAEGQLEAVKGFDDINKAAQSATHTVGEFDRKEKSVAKATNSTTREFAKQVQGLGGLVHIYATVAANVFALGAAYELLKRSADFEILQKASNQLSITTGQNFGNVANAIKEATGGVIAFKAAMQTANLALSGGLNKEQATNIASIATKAANAMGRSVPEAVTRLTQAIIKAEPELADEFGIILRLTKATNDYARSVGKVPSALTSAEKTQAVYNQFLEQGLAKFPANDVLVNPYEKLSASFSDLAVNVINVLKLPITPFITLLANSTVALSTAFAGLAAGIIGLLTPAFSSLNSKLKENAMEKVEKSIAITTARLSELSAKIKDVKSGFEDYIATAQHGLKKTDLSKVTFHGITKEQSAQLIQELTDPMNYGSQVNEEILKNVFNGDSSAAKKVIGTFTKGLQRNISKAIKEGASSVSYRGFTGSVIEAKTMVELLRASVASEGKQAELANAAATEGIKQRIRALQVYKLELQKTVVIAKNLAVQSYAKGAELGLIKSISGVSDAFSEATNKISGFGGKVVGVFNSISLVAGGFLSSALGAIGVFAQWALVIGVLVTVVSSLAEAFGLTDKNGTKAKEAVDSFSKTVDNAKKSISFLQTSTKETFSAVADNASVAVNSVKSLNDAIKDSMNAFNALDNIQGTFWALFSSNAKSAEDALMNISDSLSMSLNLLNSAARAKLNQQYNTYTVKTNVKVTKDNSHVLVGQSFLSKDYFIDLLRTQFRGSNINVIEGTNGAIELKIPVIMSLTDAEKLANSTNPITGGALVRAKDTGRKYTNIATDITKEVTKVLETIPKLDKSFEALNTTLGNNATKLRGAGQEYNQTFTILQNIDLAKKNGEIEKLKGTLDTISPELLKIINYFGNFNATLDNINISQAEQGLRAYLNTLAKITVGVNKAKERQAALNSELVSVNDNINRGEYSKITDQYRIQRQLLLEKAKILKAEETRYKANNISIQDGTASTEKQLEYSSTIASYEAQRNALINKANVLYSDQDAIRKSALLTIKDQISIENSISNELKGRLSILKSLYSVTNSTKDANAVADLEAKITDEKRKQLSLKIANLSYRIGGETGTKAQATLAEIKALVKEREILKQISIINKVNANFSTKLKDLEFNIKRESTLLKLKAAELNAAKDLFEIESKNKFSLQKSRDAAKLLVIQKSYNAEVLKQNAITKDIEGIKAKISLEEAKLAKLRSKGFKVGTEDLTIKKLKLSLIEKESEKLNAAVALEKKRYDLMEKAFALAKDTTTILDFSSNPKEVATLFGENFKRAAEEFGTSIGNIIDKTTKVVLNVVDSGVNAFTNALKSGKNALEAAKIALVNSLRDSLYNAMNEQIKYAIRNSLSAATQLMGGSISKLLTGIVAPEDPSLKAQNYANNELTKLNEITKTRLDSLIELSSRQLRAIENISLDANFSPSGNKLIANTSDKDVLNVLNKIYSVNTKQSKQSISFSKALAHSFDSINLDITSLKKSSSKFGVDNSISNIKNTKLSLPDNIGETLAKPLEKTTNDFGNLFDGLISKTSNIFGSVIDAITSSITPSRSSSTSSTLLDGLFSIGGSILKSFLPFEKGGLVNLNGYANGTVTSGPEIALIGEGKNREAVVPLPDNRSIPVDLRGSAGTSVVNNVAVTVNVSTGDGSSDVKGSTDTGRALGNLITATVKKTLIDESRPGGLLAR